MSPAHPGFRRSFGWLIVAAIPGLYAALWSHRSDGAFEPPFLNFALLLVFNTASALAVAALATRTFLGGGPPGLLLLAGGTLVFGVISAASGIALATTGVNESVTIYNLGACLGGVSNLLGALELVVPDERPRQYLERFVRARVAVTTLGLFLLAATLICTLAVAGALPRFFVQGEGPTLLRQWVLGTATASFVIAAIVAALAADRKRAVFLDRYAVGLALIAAGLGANLGVTALGTPLNWVGRCSLYLGGWYLVLATITAIRQSGAFRIPLDMLRETRDRYLRLVESSPDAIMVHRDGRWVFANPAAVQLLGANSEAELLGRGVLEMMAPDFREVVAQRMEQVLTEGRTPLLEQQFLRLDGTAVDVEVLGRAMWDVPWILEEDRETIRKTSDAMTSGMDARSISPNRNLHKDGSVLWCEWYNSSLTDASGRMTSILSMVLDVTDREKSRLELRKARDEAENASRAKDQFLAMLSHELRTPLSPILAGASHLLDDPELGGEAREDILMIRRNAELEARLIDDLLDVTRIARGKITLERRPLDACMLLRRAAEVCDADAQNKSIRLVLEMAQAHGCTLDGDVARLQQVFWNLIRNAVKFTPEGGLVRVVAQWDVAASIFEVVVSDSGIGIEPEVLPRLFVPFEQGRSAVTRQFGGLGLGLAISKSLVELHGGTIAAASEGRGCGATFTVRLPAATDAVIPAASSSPDIPQVRAGRALRILLVEDHSDTAKMMSRLLVRDGHKVRWVGSVAAAIAEVRANTFDLVVSDLGLPDGSGLDLMRQIKVNGTALPAIALSGYGQEQDVQQSREAGFCMHLIKPINPARLHEAIAAAVQPV